MAPIEKLIIKTKEGLTSNEKKVFRNHSKMLRKHFLYKCNTNAERIANAERITNTDLNTIHNMRNKKSSMGI